MRMESQTNPIAVETKSTDGQPATDQSVSPPSIVTVRMVVDGKVRTCTYSYLTYRDTSYYLLVYVQDTLVCLTEQ